MSVHPSPSPSRTSSYSNPPANGTSSIPPPPPPFVPPSGPAPPPPSLREILGQFSEHGGGDRELLLSILSAKTAEEDRIASQMAYNSLLFSLTNGSYSSLLPPFGGPPSPAPSIASIPPLPPTPTAAQHSSSSVPFSLAPSSAPPNPNPAPLTSSSKSPRPTLHGSRSPSFNHPSSSSSSSSTLHPPPPTITTTAAPSSSSPPLSGHQPQPNTLSPNGSTSPHPPPFVRRGSSTGSANGTVRKLGLLDLLGGSNVEGSGSGSGSVGLTERREESFVRGSETAGAEARVQGSPGVVETPKKRDADDGEEEMEVDEIDDD